MKLKFPQNRTRGGILLNMLIAFVSLFVNGFGVYLTIHADIGSAPWDVHFNATSLTHQKMHESVFVFIGKAA